MYKINFEVASERATIKEHMLLPPNDGQVKHPEHLNEHEMLQVLQRYALNGDVEKTKEWILKFPEVKRKDLKEMTQQKTIQAMGRIGRNQTQQEYTIRFRDDNMLHQLFKPPVENKEAVVMCRLFQ